ncbi:MULTISPECIES: flagellin [Rhizobium/Agrobacterium group]|uniref:Flagellin n=2 Tax=Agrobacterium tumefaciens complex TaxID=1183400 RepID=A0A9W5EZB5_9HYPH|nr:MULTISPECIES: flagellin [Rhizobium/Agrobacterium group]CAD7036275.1 flagellin [Rhizobium sp. P007]CUW88579.1 Flagellin/flagellar hook associated protein [Agrobacterium genomosp. 2 str. CFBP 5494]
MTSVLTNGAAISALQTLRSISSNLDTTQRMVSSGLRVGAAADNAAYWSISTTMRSDRMAISAVYDALGLGAAKVDTAYAGMSAVTDVLAEFKAKLIAAKENGVDKSKIQSELNQLKEQVLSIATSASFSGQNWLNTDIVDIYDSAVNRSSVVSSFVRASSGVSVKTMDIDLSRVSLFNSTGGGLLQADARDIRTIGGIRSLVSVSDPSNIGGDYTRYEGIDGSSGYMLPEWNAGSAGRVSLQFPDNTPLDFNVPGAEISFTITLDREASNPDGYSGVLGENQELPGPYNDGYTTTVTVTKADIDAYNPSLGGVISTNTQFAEVLNAKLYPLGASVAGNYTNASTGLHNPTLITITTLQQHGYGSHVEISAVTSSGVSTGGLKTDFDFGYRGSGLVLDFKPFIVHRDGKDEDGIDVSFTFSVNGASSQTYSFDRTYVNEVLGRDDGKVDTSENMAILLHSLLDDDWPDLVIEGSAGYVVIKSNPDVDRQWGSGTRIAFDSIRVSNEPRSTLNFLDIDIVQKADQIDTYIAYLETVTANVIDAAAMLGAVQTRMDLQSEFASRLSDSIGRGIGRLVDANMDEASTRLKALQTQQQLSIQSLSIANSNAEILTQLFR